MAGAAVSQSLNHVELELTCAHEKKSQQIKREERNKREEERNKREERKMHK